MRYSAKRGLVIRPTRRPSVRLSVCLSVSLSVCPSVRDVGGLRITFSKFAMIVNVEISMIGYLSFTHSEI